jgi:hypothetical protein
VQLFNIVIGYFTWLPLNFIGILKSIVNDSSSLLIAGEVLAETLFFI